ncbi:MAG TPA: VWA domain-containing protein [Pirellulales bacterium]|jgi:Mg-chelatase subunit ChlD|nr:VWA domain-containing protein [Pirellulales bacterium]
MFARRLAIAISRFAAVPIVLGAILATLWLVGDPSPRTAAAAEPGSTAALSEGKATLLGVEGKGTKFVYVFDRSGSMGVPGNKPLNRAKAELLRSIDALSDLQQFYIIFYNHAQKMFQIDPTGKRLIFASDANKRAAKQWVDGIEAGGGTKHADALLMALRMHPDAIFMLTDGDPPDDLTADELARVQRANTAATVINVIQISPPDTTHENMLIRLANHSGGQHVYVDFDKK